mgnify:CR=1 FL=1
MREYLGIFFKEVLRRIERLKGFFIKFIFSPKKNRGKEILLFPLTLVSFFYRQLIILRYKCYQRGFLFSRKLPIPVISVGNLTVGGTGKTPTAIYLAKFFQSHGKRVAILSRGYKGRAAKKINVVSDGEKIILGANEAGDEPFLLAEKLSGVPILTGKDRGLLGEYAWRNFSTEVVILDDGFQHLKVQKDVDIVLIDGQNPFGNGYLIPRGSLREPPEQLKRAQLILVTKLEREEDNEKVKKIISPYTYSTPIFFAYYIPVMLEDLKKREKFSLDYLQGKKVVALAGIAKPESFSSLLTRLGAEVVKTMFFPDHYRYQPKDLNNWKGDLPIITTKKDAVKLKHLSLPNRKILVLDVEIKIEKEKEFQRILKNYLLFLN